MPTWTQILGEPSGAARSSPVACVQIERRGQSVSPRQVPLIRTKKLSEQALHAETLEFIHPTKKKWVSFKSKLPKDFKKTLDLLNNLSG